MIETKTGDDQRDDDEAIAATPAWVAVLLGLVVLVAFIVLALLLAGRDDDPVAVETAASTSTTSTTTTEVVASRDLVAEVVTGLQNEGMGAIAVDAAGPDGVVLTGEVPDQAALDRASRIASSIAGGADHVDNRLTIIDAPAQLPEPGEVTISVEGDVVTLRGTVADQATIDTLVESVSGSSSGLEVVNRLEVGPVDSAGGIVLLDGTVASEDQRTALIAMGEELADLTEGSLEERLDVDEPPAVEQAATSLNELFAANQGVLFDTGSVELSLEASDVLR